MSNFYQPYMSSMAGTEENLSPITPDSQVHPQHPQMQTGSPGTALVNPYQSLGYFTGFPDPSGFQQPKHSNRSRRKSAPGMDHVKHRRTRSGCYTCRSRRVKCDEAHPVCERCRKGKRECIYPEPPTSKGSGGSAAVKEAPDSTQVGSPSNSQDESEEEDEKGIKLESIPDEDEPEERVPQRFQSIPSLRTASIATTQIVSRVGTRHSSETPSLDGTKSSSPSGSTGTGTSFNFVGPFHPSDTSLVCPAQSDWSHLSRELREYFDYFDKSVTHHHYCVVSDPDDFFRTYLPRAAARNGNEILLYAVVGFAAYHNTVQNPNGKIQDFLTYYNKSVTLLLDSLKKHETQNLDTLLTILQLATIEEYLGDWVSLMGHQKAALQILTEIYDPESVMNSPWTRMILTWYVRFDIFVGMIGGFETRLPRIWFSAAVKYNEREMEKEPDNLSWKIETCAAALRLISVDMSLLYAKGGRREIPSDIFAAEHGELTKQLYEWRGTFDSALKDRALLVTDFEYKSPFDEGDIKTTYTEPFLYRPPFFSITLLFAEWHSMVVMHKSQEAFTLQQEPTTELKSLAYAICEVFETVEKWPPRPDGALVILQACLAIAALFLPRDMKHHMWIRRKFAFIEGLGYIFPLTMRTRMAELFRDSSCVSWWLPNGEGLGAVLRSIRAFADERTANPVSQQTENLREMSAIFAKMRLHVDDDPAASAEPSGVMGFRGKGKNTRG